MPKKVLIALPPGLLEEVDYMAKFEHRTRSDLIREALRVYKAKFVSQENVHAHLTGFPRPQLEATAS